MAKYGEIALKGLNKNTFEDILVRNIKRRFKKLGHFEITRNQSTIYIKPLDEEQNIDEAVEKLKTVFGIAAIQRSAVLPKDFDEIVKQGIPYLSEVLSSARTFKVGAKRSDKKFPLKSPDIQRELGGAILSAFPHLTVDVQVHLFIKVKAEGLTLTFGQTGILGILVFTTELQFCRSLCFYLYSTRAKYFLCRP